MNHPERILLCNYHLGQEVENNQHPRSSALSPLPITAFSHPPKDNHYFDFYFHQILVFLLNVT